jgi:hypothetical protein
MELASMNLKHAAFFLALLGSGSAFSAEQKFNDWSVDYSNDKSRIYAATVNDSGSVFGEFCTLATGKCLWILGMSVTCDGKSNIPLLASAANGSASLELQCGGKIEGGTIYQYFFTKWQDVEALIKDSSNVGFAFAMANGQFKVSRFSLSGRSDAVTLAETVAFSQPVPKPSASHTGTGDTTL